MEKKIVFFPIRRGLDLNSKIKGSKIIVLDSADHIIVLNWFDELVKIIDKFILEKEI